MFCAYGLNKSFPGARFPHRLPLLPNALLFPKHEKEMTYEVFQTKLKIAILVYGGEEAVFTFF